jgi:NADPH-dependent 2,4-dienoyl-CoA reductase/sulfur reductase-like enzyme/peroxiredoxin family protein/rhodanese-related sulfurtransferase/TusA-related sulfurtransferase
MSQKIVIVGGVAGGATAAARARRLSENAEIVLIERGEEVSWANCGLPYYIGGEITDRDALIVQQKAGLARRFNLDIRTRQEVVSVNREQKTVRVRNLLTQETYDESYDKLLLSPGAAALVPPLPGVDHPKISVLRNLEDMDRIKGLTDQARTALVIGGGFIGLELAENLKHRGLDVALVELLPQVMPPLDPEMAQAIHQTLADQDVQLHLGDAVTEFVDVGGQVRASLKSGQTITADMAVMSVGVRPETGFIRDSGLELNQRQQIVVNEHLQTSDPDIYAVGDAVEVRDAVLGGRTAVPLAGPANRQARLAMDHAFGRAVDYRGVYGTSIVRVFDLAVGMTGRSEKVLKQQNVPYQTVYAHRGNHVGYYPGATQVSIKLLFAPEDGKILGAQALGQDGIDKRIDVLATAMYAGLTVADLEALELAYAPQFGAAKDPINIVGYVANNAWKGEEDFVSPEEVRDAGDRWTLLDIRTPEEFEAGAVPNALHVPLDALRDRIAEVPRDKPVVTYCGVGQRAYYATRILRHHGFDAKNMTGGIVSWKLMDYSPPEPRPLRAADSTQTASAAAMAGATDQQESDSMTNKSETLDLRGLMCPGPLASLAQAARNAPVGTVLHALASDAGFASDVQAWCQRGGHELINVGRDNGTITADICVGGAPQPAVSAAGSESDAVARNKTIVVFSGDLDRVMGAFVIANAAADMGDKVTLFFTFWGLNALRKDQAVPVEKDVMSRMFGWMMPRGARRLKLSNMNMGGMGTAMMKGVMKKKGVDDLPTMIASAQRKGVRLVACSMSMDVMGLQQSELLDGVEIAGAAGYLANASEARVNLFI